MSMKYYGSEAWEEVISAVTATNSVELGARRNYLGEEYVYCYNAGGSDIYPKYGVKPVTAASGYSIANTSLVDVVNPLVGICKHATIAAASYGWIMTRGWNQLVAHADSTITGDYVAIALGAAGTFHQSYQIATGTNTVFLGTHVVCGYGLGANTASGGSFYGYIRSDF